MQDNELQHFGIPGMKWGKRKGKYDSYKQNIKRAKQNLKKTKKDNKYEFGDGWGIDGIRDANRKASNISRAKSKLENAKDAYKIAKSKNPAKTEENIYLKKMGKTGIRGSAADIESGGKSTKLYNRIAQKKGKEYADRIERKIQTKAIATIATSTILTGASIAASVFLEDF